MTVTSMTVTSMTVRTPERAAGVVTLAAMLATPFAPRGSRRRIVLATVTVVGGAVRSWSIDRRSRGTVRATGCAAAIATATFVAEVWGVRSGRLFGRYRYTDRLRPQFLDVPLLVPMAWCAVALPAHATAHRALGRRSSVPARIGLGSIALTTWDLFLDPQMTAERYWQWMGGGRYRGTPVRNFAGWLVVAAIAMAIIEASGRSPDDDAHLVSYGSLATLETLAFATFWRDPLVAVAGGAAMLPLAVLAASQPAAERAVASTRTT